MPAGYAPGDVHTFKQPFIAGSGVGKNMGTGPTRVLVVRSIDHDLTPQVRDGRDYQGLKSTSPGYLAPVKSMKELQHENEKSGGKY
jgi:uncharacterized spore protein YtfJ